MAKCNACNGTGQRWGWWTPLITLPLSILLEITIQLLPWVVLLIVFFVGISIYSSYFEPLVWFLTMVVAGCVIYFGFKGISPRCLSCDGTGARSNEV